MGHSFIELAMARADSRNKWLSRFKAVPTAYLLAVDYYTDD